MDSRGVFLLVVAVAAAAAAARGVGGDFAADKEECLPKLMALMTCVAYVQGQAAAPTPDCCSGLKTVLQSSPKCLCVLIRDHDDQGIPVKIDVNKALALPSACAAPANVSDCPKLLNLPPGSKEAEVFEQFAKQQGAQASPSGAGSTGAQKSAASGPATRTRGWLWAATTAAAAIFFFVDALPLAAVLLVD